MEREKKVLSTVHEKDLISLLGNFGVNEAFERGELKCRYCHQIVSIDNIYSVFPESGTLYMVCDKSECIASLFSYLDERSRAKTE